jgi:hypothetical protein
MASHKKYLLSQSPLYRLQSKKRLAEILHVSLKKLKKLTNTEGLYSERDRFDPKKGKNRHEEEPKHSLKIVHKRIKELLTRIELPNYILCPNQGFSCVDNAEFHLSSSQLIKLDIKKYFPSTPSRRVFWFFNTHMGCSRDVAGILAKISTYKGHIPTGSPLSPILTYFAHVDMWEKIGEIAASANCKLSVWADDIAISGDPVPGKIVQKIKEAIKHNGLQYHKEEKYAGNKKPRILTGIKIKDGKLKALNRHHFKRFKLSQSLKKAIPITIALLGYLPQIPPVMALKILLVRDWLTLVNQFEGIDAHIKQVEARS